MNRLQRLSAILIQLQSGHRVRAGDMAERFGVSLRTVYRDIQSLEATGVPVIGEAGSGYRLVDGYRLPPVHFTRGEIHALLTAQKLIEKQSDQGLDADFKAALFKIKAILRNPEKDLLSSLEENIEVLHNPYLPAPDRGNPFLPKLIQSISDKTRVYLDYTNRQDVKSSRRETEPIGLFYLLGKWHLVAYCHLRKDYRDFRLDRIRELGLTSKPFAKRHPTLKKYLSQLTREEKLNTIEIRMNKEDVHYLGEQKYYNGYVSERPDGDQVTLTFLTSSLTGFAHWYMMIGTRAEILKPEILKEQVHRMATELLKNIK
ncbi:MAG TPA: YafY family protein [Saprospiraceae bacterium]|nr:YafY family protein [Saprospiraceae bacterium]HNT21902.1 YafY family protein [Saprospiraceae bacterium]